MMSWDCLLCFSERDGDNCISPCSPLSSGGIFELLSPLEVGGWRCWQQTTPPERKVGLWGFFHPLAFKLAVLLTNISWSELHKTTTQTILIPSLSLLLHWFSSWARHCGAGWHFIWCCWEKSTYFVLRYLREGRVNNLSGLRRFLHWDHYICKLQPFQMLFNYACIKSLQG